MAVVRVKLQLEEVGSGVKFETEQSLFEDEAAWQRYELADGTTDQAVPFNLTTGVTTVDILLLTADQQISWRLAATDTAITLDANRFHVLYGCNITALLLSNASGSTANVRVYIAGT